MAEREGFEPPVQFPVLQFSRLAPSTTRPPLQLPQFYYSDQLLLAFRGTFPLGFNRVHPAKLAVHGFSRPPVSTARCHRHVQWRVQDCDPAWKLLHSL